MASGKRTKSQCWLAWNEHVFKKKFIQFKGKINSYTGNKVRK